MKDLHWLGMEALGVLHQSVVDDHGGDSLIRDAHRLEAAVMRPLQQSSYGEQSLSRLTAAYAVGLVQGHPFMDGNKRTGFMAAAAFLELNGRVLVAPETEVVLQTLGLAAGEVTEAQYAVWLEKSSRPSAPKPKKRRK